MRLVDLSHTLTEQMPRFSDRAPAPQIRPWMSHQEAAESGLYEGCTCELTELTLITSLGTYMDSPFHFHQARASIEALPLEQLVRPGVVVDCRGIDARQGIGPDALEGLSFAGCAVLFCTGWSRYWGEAKYHEYPYLTASTAQALAEGGAAMVGIDTLIIDDKRDPTRPVHVTLLGQDIPIIENLTGLSALCTEPAGFVFHAAPVKVKGAAAFPVRAYAVVHH